MPADAGLTPSILITGARGQVGFELCRSLAPLGRVVAVDRSRCDLARPEQVRQLVREVRPDVIVNAAAYTAVDRAEDDATLAFAVNRDGPALLAEEAARAGILLVHYSTDYVFDGAKDSPYVEEDRPAPLSVYGHSKLAGEQAVLGSAASALVLRTSWVAGSHGGNFARTMLALARQRDTLRVVADQIGAPTMAALLADVTAQIVARHWLHGDRAAFAGGLYHVTAAGETSWHGYACEVLRLAAQRGVALQAMPEAVEPIPTSAYPRPARRPANSRLDTAKLRRTFGIHLPDWRSGVAQLLDQILDGEPACAKA
ncbi:dTDP-4-dehydrorhamnose reductase [Cupriavidus sp. AU9028]|uniref:dTDP-4-dehydrorhamnose reductase n=1 Tax=Cupriavidus sp. AU9028 TaxID=2871157 RepID=UPI001C93AFDF|nr:dTDP-4-dehydrorhamnose reductase [Cupriavidus sp. AU9028]MBY4898109.1 dTDP-4-dehydrorhamnose reductase [Cupriavidus sp. AU9028]